MSEVKTTFVFRGLCTFIERKDEQKYEAYLLAGAMDDGADGHGHDHDASKAHIRSLAIPIESIEKGDADLTWKPDAVIHGPGGAADQVGVWLLPPGELKLVATPAGAGKLPEWRNRNASIDLQELHAADKAKSKPRKDITRGAVTVVDLVDGEIESADFTKYNDLRLHRGSATDPFAYGGLPRAFVWTISGERLRVVISHADKGKISLREEANVNVTNVAPVPTGEGLAHFKHYYEVFVDVPGDERKVRLTLGKRDEPVFDCVPPTAGPNP